MVTEVEYALMAGRAYQSTRAEVNLFPSLVGWSEPLNKREINTSTGFEASYFQRGNEIVISFAGTNPKDPIFPLPGPDIQANIGLATGVGSDQLRDAAIYYLNIQRQLQATNTTAVITFTGHSLGGGLAALMGVFFGKQAVTFDQAPFANSAEASLIPSDVAANLKTYLLEHNYTENELQGLTNFLTQRAALPLGEIPNSNLVKHINVQGELLSGVPWNLPDRIEYQVVGPGLSIDLMISRLAATYAASPNRPLI